MTSTRLTLMLSLGLCLTFAACGSSDGETANAAGGGAGGDSGGAGHGAGGDSGGAGSDAGGDAADGGGDAGAGGGGNGGAGHCDCVPVSLLSGAVMKLAQAGDCADDEGLYAEPNPSLCPPVFCMTSGYGFYSGACSSGTPDTTYTSFEKSSSCFNLPDGEAGYFSDVDIYWSCMSTDRVVAFDQTYCPVSKLEAFDECDSDSVCIPKDLGPVCIPTSAVPAGWQPATLYQTSQCEAATDELATPTEFTVYSSADCQGGTIPFQEGACLPGAKSFRHQPLSPSKTAQNVAVADDRTVQVACRP